ncbi:hypothetical protein HCH_06816 [Hahella chejuensis KCTC 2396]|uniref:Uncharacterized protein n=1 Tax=Hahella chejuensis (strain KCTC 2396) TaxID=349521 RepID=Q2S7D5_HAHCH|nr:hypothetical protein [Hahella chejuensis]ABC33439.1 hypothetical protein HCH_06816 [Hahella chejuensis KCTC 2396]
MHEFELACGIDGLNDFLDALGGQLDAPLAQDKIALALEALAQLGDGEEEDIEFDLRYQDAVTPVIIKAAVTHNVGPRLVFATPSESLFEAARRLA